MDYPVFIEELYCSVLKKEMSELNVDGISVRRAIADLADAYKVHPKWELSSDSKTADYNDAAHRCAYLHKYAMLHTGLLCEVLPMAFTIHSVKEFVRSKESLSLCSLGGGPGTDIVALLLVIQEIFGLKECETSIIDCATGWECTFRYTVSYLRALADPDISAMVDKSRFKYQYLGADLLGTSSSNDTRWQNAIEEADVLTMVKFVSAAACCKTERMIEKIFRIMKPGSMLLFVDNAAGRFYEMLHEKAEKCGMQSAFGPLFHHVYEESRFCRNLYGCHGQSKTRVTIVLWRKQHRISPNQAGEEDCVDSPYTQFSDDAEENHTDDPNKDCCAIM